MEQSIDELLKLIYAILISSITPLPTKRCWEASHGLPHNAHRALLNAAYHLLFAILHSLNRWHLLRSTFSFQLIKAVLTTAQLDYFET